MVNWHWQTVMLVQYMFVTIIVIGRTWIQYSISEPENLDNLNKYYKSVQLEQSRFVDFFPKCWFRDISLNLYQYVFLS